MKTRMAYCGLLCYKCPIFTVTKTGNLQEKRKLARLFSFPDRHLTVKEVECYGCTQTDRKILKGCDNCRKRLCAMKKKLDNCGQCASYPCQELDYFLTQLWQSGARERLARVSKKT